MSGYTVAHLDEIDEISDGRCPWRPVRQHFGIMSFGINAWTARDAGDRIINEHDEDEEDATRSSTSCSGAARRSSSTASGWTRPPARSSSPARRQADGVRRGAGDDDRRARRHAGEGVRAQRLGALGAARPALRGRQVRRGRRPRTRADRGSSRVRRPVLQRRVLREPRRADGRRDRAPPARDRAGGAVSLVRRRGLRLRPDPRRAGVQGADEPAESGVRGGPSRVMSYFANRAATVARRRCAVAGEWPQFLVEPVAAARACRRRRSGPARRSD